MKYGKQILFKITSATPSAVLFFKGQAMINLVTKHCAIKQYVKLDFDAGKTLISICSSAKGLNSLIILG
jgi:hypothetical protein